MGSTEDAVEVGLGSMLWEMSGGRRGDVFLPVTAVWGWDFWSSERLPF